MRLETLKELLGSRLWITLARPMRRRLFAEGGLSGSGRRRGGGGGTGGALGDDRLSPDQLVRYGNLRNSLSLPITRASRADLARDG